MTCNKYEGERKTNKKLIAVEQEAEDNKRKLELYQKTFERFMQHQKAKVLVVD